MSEDIFPILVTMLAALVQGCLGFGGGLISMAILSLVWEVKDATAAMAPVGLLMVSMLSVKLRHSMTPRELVPLFVAIPVGVFGGVYALGSLPSTLLKSLLGLTLVVFVLHSTKKTVSRPQKDSGRFAAAAGALSGFTGAALNAAGPPVLIYASITGWQKDQFRANLQLIFLVIAVFAVGGLALGGFFSAASLTLSLKLVPGVLAGALIGTWLAALIPQEVFKKTVFAGMTVIGLYFTVSPLLVGL